MGPIDAYRWPIDPKKKVDTSIESSSVSLGETEWKPTAVTYTIVTQCLGNFIHQEIEL